MTWELIHTSAPRGMMVPHGGFVTVAATAGLPRSLIEVLEALSAFDPGVPRRSNSMVPHAVAIEDGAGRGGAHGDTARGAATSEVTILDDDALHAHRIVDVAGRRYSVLSRIVRAGLDHTGRPNRLAHHIVLEPRERPAAGPAAALRDFPGFLNAWNGPPMERPFGPKVAPMPRPAAPCATWSNRFGDAGWAGEVLRLLRESAEAPLVIVLSQPMDIRPLMDELLALIPAEARWSFTFTSRSMAHRAGVEAAIRFVASGDRDHEVVRRRPGVRLLEPREISPGSPWSDAAREGLVVEWRTSDAPPSRTRSLHVPARRVDPMSEAPAGADEGTSHAPAAATASIATARVPAKAPLGAAARWRGATLLAAVVVLLCGLGLWLWLRLAIHGAAPAVSEGVGVGLDAAGAAP